MAVRVTKKIDECAAARLDRLDLHGHGMIKVPPRVFTLTHVTTLRLGANHLVDVPREIGQLTNLRVLNLISNQLVALPREVALLRALETLHLSNNQFTTPPWIVGSLPRLGAATLSGNPLDYAALVPEPTLRMAVQRGETTSDWNETAAWLRREWAIRDAAQLPASGSGEYLHEGLAAPASPGTATVPAALAAGATMTAAALVPFAHWAIDDDVSKHPPPGPFGRILAAIYRNRHLAARHLRRDELDTRGADALAAEAAVLVRLSHRNLLPLVGVCIDHPPDVFLLTEEAARGSLARALQDPDHQARLTTLASCRRLAVGIVEGLHYLHVHGIVHGALCADSVWLDEDDRPRLTDVGVAAHLDRQRLRQACPVRYWPPERMAALLAAPPPSSTAAAAFSVAADVWALGATLYELYAGGEVPFSAYVDDAVLTKLVLHQRGTLERPTDCPGGDWDCIRPCFAFLPQDRCSTVAVLAEYERLGRTSAAAP